MSKAYKRAVTQLQEISTAIRTLTAQRDAAREHWFQSNRLLAAALADNARLHARLARTLTSTTLGEACEEEPPDGSVVWIDNDKTPWRCLERCDYDDGGAVALARWWATGTDWPQTWTDILALGQPILLCRGGRP